MKHRKLDAARLILLCASICFVVVCCHDDGKKTGTSWDKQSMANGGLSSYPSNSEDSLSLRTLTMQESSPPKQKSSSTSPKPAPQSDSQAPAVDNGTLKENKSTTTTVPPSTTNTQNQTTSVTIASESKNGTGPSIPLSLEAFSLEILADMGIRKGDVNQWLAVIRDELRTELQSYLLQDLSQQLENLVFVRLQNDAGTRHRVLSSSSKKKKATYDYGGEAVFANVAPRRVTLIDQQREALTNIQAIQKLLDSNDLLAGVSVKSIQSTDSVSSTQNDASSNDADEKRGVDTENLIMGGSIAAGVVVAVLSTFLICCICKKRRRRRQESLRKDQDQDPPPPPLPLPNTSEISSENGSPTKLFAIKDSSYAEDESSLVSTDDIMADLEEFAKAGPNAYLQLNTGGANGDIVAQVVTCPRKDDAAPTSYEISTTAPDTSSTNAISVFRHRSFEHDVEAQELLGDTMNSRVVSISKSRSQETEDSHDDNRRTRRSKTASTQCQQLEINSKGVLTATKNIGGSQARGTISSPSSEEQESSSIGRKPWMLSRYPWSAEKTPTTTIPPRQDPVEQQGKIVWNKRGILSIGKATQSAESTHQTPNIITKKHGAPEATDECSNKANSEVCVNKKGILSITKSSPDENRVTSSLQTTPAEASETPQQYCFLDKSLELPAAENSLVRMNKKGILSAARSSRSIGEGFATNQNPNHFSGSSYLEGHGEPNLAIALAHHETPKSANGNLRINYLGLLTVSKAPGVTEDSVRDAKKRSTPDTLDVSVAETPSAVGQHPRISSKSALSGPRETPYESVGKGMFYSPDPTLKTGSTDSMDGYSLSGGIVESNHGMNISRISRPTPQPSWMISKGQKTVTPNLDDDYDSDAESDFTYGDVGHGEKNAVVAALLSNSIDSEDTSDYLLKELNDESMLVLKEKGPTAASKATRREHSYPSPDYPVTSCTQSHVSISESMPHLQEKVSDDESFDYLPSRQKSTKDYETSLSLDLHSSQKLTKGYEPSSSSIELDSSVPLSLYSSGKSSYDDQSQPFDETSVDYGTDDGNSVEITRPRLGVSTKNVGQTSMRAMVTPDGDIDVNPSNRTFG